MLGKKNTGKNTTVLPRKKNTTGKSTTEKHNSGLETNKKNIFIVIIFVTDLINVIYYINMIFNTHVTLDLQFLSTFGLIPIDLFKTQ